MEYLLQITTGCTIISTMWVLAIASIIGLLLLQIENAHLHVLQLIITTAAWTYALHSLYTLDGTHILISLVVLVFAGGFTAAMTSGFVFFSTSGFFTVLFFVLACFTVWFMNVYLVLSCSLAAIFRLGVVKKVIGVAVLGLMAVPFLSIAGIIPDTVDEQIVRPYLFSPYFIID